MKWGVVAVAIVKNEADYLPDWLVYHMAIGVDHFFIYDNGSADATSDCLRPFIAAGRVTQINWPVRAGQIDAYNHAIRLLNGAADWVGFYDIDEFLVLHRHKVIVDFLAETGADQVMIPWRNFPYAGHNAKPGGPTFLNFFWAYPSQQNAFVQVKSFVRPEHSTHVTAHFSRVSPRSVTKLADGTAMERPNFRVQQPSYLGAQFNHYATRSLQENNERLRNGQVNGEASKRIADFLPFTEKMASAMDYDDAILLHRDAYFAQRLKWRRVSVNPHRFGMQQSAEVLSSFGPILWYFGKSFGNYQLSCEMVKPITEFAFKREISDAADSLCKEIPVTNFSDISVIFSIPDKSYLRYFIGTIHFGDLVRRFDLTVIELRRAEEFDTNWYCSAPFSGTSGLIIFDIEARSDLALEVAVEGKVFATDKVPPGRHAGAFYFPVPVERDVTVAFSICGSGVAREVIMNSLP